MQINNASKRSDSFGEPALKPDIKNDADRIPIFNFILL